MIPGVPPNATGPISSRAMTGVFVFAANFALSMRTVCSCAVYKFIAAAKARSTVFSDLRYIAILKSIINMSISYYICLHILHS